MTPRPGRGRGARGICLAVVVGIVATACSSEPGPVIQLGAVTAEEVVETVAAPATLEPRDRVAVTAPASGTVAELLVGDGDVVTSGDPLLRLAAPSIDQTIAQAEAAVAAADALAGIQGGVDLSPIIGAVGDQLEAVVPGLLQTLAEQAATIPDAAARERVNQSIRDAIATYNASQAQLQQAEREAVHAADSATASRRAAAEAQRRQAELALEAARTRADDLLVTAPGDGVVELARGGGDAAGGPGVDGLEDLAGAGDLAGADVEELLGGAGATNQSTAPIAVGAPVGAGQTLLTVYDLAGFRAAGRVDEIDVVRVEEGQDATVLVDAYPEARIRGVVEHVAIEPTSASTGGVVYPVAVRLVDVPEGVDLRVGLSGSVEIVTRVLDADTVVPSSALRRRGEQDVVVVARDGTFAEVDVVVEAIGSDTAAVVGALDPGDLVVVVGIDEVAPGDPVPGDVRTVGPRGGFPTPG